MGPETPPTEEAFDRFVEAIALTPDELAGARAAAMQVVEALRKALRPVDDGRIDYLISGGVGKRTGIHPLPAVDLLYRPPDETMADHLPEILAAAFTVVDSGPDNILVPVERQVVCLRPTIVRQDAYLILVDGSWTTTNPVAEVAALRVADSLTNGRTTRLLSLLKSWRAECAVPIASFALEILAREFATEYGERPWAATFTDFFAWSRQRTPASFDRPGSQGSLAIDAGWHAQAESAYWRGVLAARHEASGDRAEALAEWQRLLGPRFGAPPRFNLWQVKPELGPREGDLEEQVR